MAILVTGGAGFIGSHVCRELLKHGKEVVCVDDFNDYYNPALKEERIKIFLEDQNFKLYRNDITNLEAMKTIFDKHKIEKVVHLAARAGVRASLKNPLLYEKVNVQGTMNILELSKNVDNFVFASSSSVYGQNEKLPFSEQDNVDNPISPYAATKRAGELLCYTYHALYDIPMTCLRFFTVYGPSGRPDMAIYKFTKAILDGEKLVRYGDGSMKRDFTYIADIVGGILSSLEHPHDYEIINLGNSHPIEVNKLISIIEKTTGKKAVIEEIPAPPEDVPITYADISKAKKLLGYDPRTKIEEGVKDFVEWYMAQYNR